MAYIYRYLDCLDTVRTQLTDEDRIRHGGELMFRIFTGEVVRISQTQAFDSGQLLAYSNNAAFCALVASGAIEIVMREGVVDPITAFKNAVDDDTFHLSAWTSIENPRQQGDEEEPQAFHISRKDAKAIFEEANRNRQLPHGMPDALHKNWKALEQLNGAYKAYSNRGQPPIKAARSEFKLREQLEAAHRSAQPYPYLANPLKEMLSKVEGEQRSAYHRYLRSLNADRDIKASLNSLVDIFYNRIVGSSLQSKADFTTFFHDVRDIASSIDSQPHSKGEIFTEPLNHLKLNGLTWQTLLDIRAIHDDPSLATSQKLDRIKDRSFIAANEIFTESANEVSLKIVPSVAALGVNTAVGMAVGFVFDHFLPGALLPAALVSSLLTDIGLKISDRTRHTQDRYLQDKLANDLIAIQRKQIEGQETKSE